MESKLKRNIDAWPKPTYDKNVQPHFLFILTPPYSGSTALAELLNSSHRTTFLQERAEGQWLVPGMCENDRWDAAKQIDWDSVKATWLSKYQEIQQLVKNVDIVIEKSPPNMLRIKQLISIFPNYSLLAFNRNPYANCVSIMYRNYKPDNKSQEERHQVLGVLAKSWLEKSALIRDLVLELKINMFTYEEFCSDISGCIKQIDLPFDVLRSINVASVVKVKDYKPQPIISQNERQLSNLTAAEVGLLNDIFAKESDVLSFFGYAPYNFSGLEAEEQAASYHRKAPHEK